MAAYTMYAAMASKKWSLQMKIHQLKTGQEKHKIYIGVDNNNVVLTTDTVVSESPKRIERSPVVVLKMDEFKKMQDIVNEEVAKSA